MLSLELARKLKDAGLKWEPKWGDFFQMIVMEKSLTTCLTDDWSVNSIRKESAEFRDKARSWIPALSDLLAEIEGRGYEWELRKGWICIWAEGDIPFDAAYTGTADTPEDTAATALLYILRGDTNESC